MELAKQYAEGVVEMKFVLENYTIILEKAGELCPAYDRPLAKQLLYTIFKIYVPALEGQIEVYRGSLNRNLCQSVDSKIQDLKGKYGQRDASQWADEDFISPIVLLLKLASDCGKIKFDEEQDGWGRLASVRGYLLSLNLKTYSRKERLRAPITYWPGIPSCIVSILPVWTSHPTVISASNDKFLMNKALHKKGRVSRFASLSRMEDTTAVRERVRAIMSRSNEFKKEYEALQMTLEKNHKIDEHQLADLKKKSGLLRIHIPGIMASWTPAGKYMPVDEKEQAEWYQVAIRDINGVIIGQKWVTTKTVWDSDSCAEWLGFLELACFSGAIVLDATQW